MMSERGFRHLPVVDDGKLVGILSTTDIGRLAVDVPELMNKPVGTRGGELVGVVTTYDLLDAVARRLRGDET